MSKSNAEPIRPRDKGDVPDDPLSRMRHSASHVMADAVRRLRPDAKVAIGPAIENGFYYDFDTEPFAPEDAERIEAEMRKIIAENLPFERHVVPRDEALERCSDRAARSTRSRSSNRSRRARRSRTSSTATSSIFAGGRTSSAPATSRRSRCMSFAGAYWRGDERNAQLQRVYGTAFPSAGGAGRVPGAHRGGQAPRPPHARQAARSLFVRRAGRARGSSLWHPKGAFVRYQIEDLIRRENVRRGYELVYTPHVAREQLLETSGHLAHYKENLFGGMELDGQRLPRQADELPVPHRDLPLAAAIVPRPAAALLRARHGLPLRALGRTARPPARARPHSGRWPPVRPRGSDRRRDRQAASTSRSTCCALFGFQDLQLFLADPPGELHGRGRACGTAPRPRCAACWRTSGTPYQLDEGGGAFYGPEDRPQDQGRPRSRVAVRDRAARLPAPGCASSWTTSPATGRASDRS